MTEAMQNIDSIISNMSTSRRVIYFRSENRQIIPWVIDQSVALRDKLSMHHQLSKPSDGGWYKALCGSGRCVDYMTVFKLDGLTGRINLKEDQPIPAALYLTDFQIYPAQHRGFLLKAFLDCAALENAYLLISSPAQIIPDGFSGEIELVSDGYISVKDIQAKLTQEVRAEEERRKKTFFTDGELAEFAQDFVGLTEEQINTAFMRMEGKLCTSLREGKHLEKIVDEKIKEVAKDPTVKFIPYPKEESVAGLGHYSAWLRERADDFHNPVRAAKEGTPSPKGVLLCGVPGTGKTAMAKETARRLNISLVQFDISRIQNSNFGESEERMRRYLERISAFGSCVMLMDEVEKVFSINEQSHEVKRSMLSLLLDWMQTRQANVFTFITANSISALPPELLRDGRVSGRFFAFMPSRDDLREILRLKLQPLVRSHKLNKDFRDLLREPLQDGDQGSGKDELAEAFDEIARRAKADHRYLFMTGANLESLVEMTNRALRKKGEAVYSVGAYTDQLVKSALSKDFVPQGQSNMDDLVKMWMTAQKLQYQDVSDHMILPFDSLVDGKFRDMPAAPSFYDQYLRDVLMDKIRKNLQEESDRKAALKRMANEEK